MKCAICKCIPQTFSAFYEGGWAWKWIITKGIHENLCPGCYRWATGILS